MKILLHICCGPCAIMPMLRLLEEGHELTGYYYNPNIHPLTEYLRRREGAGQAAERCGVPIIWALDPADYAPEEWLEHALQKERAPASPGSPRARCVFCLTQRLERTGLQAAAGGFDAFTSSLLYSRRQPHRFIAGQGTALAGKPGRAPFLYRDFRPHWQQGVTFSKAWNIYRQQYCGCLFSEYERHARDLAAENSRLLEMSGTGSVCFSGQNSAPEDSASEVAMVLSPSVAVV